MNENLEKDKKKRIILTKAYQYNTKHQI